MEYKQVKISAEPFESELVELMIALLSEIGFEAFYEEENFFTAYIPKNLYDAGLLSEVLKNPAFLSLKINTGISDSPDINWNAKWEQEYEPIVIDDICAILAPHHKPEAVKHIIRIEPKMSFGTGHHETTRLMIRQIYQSDLQNKTVLDLGSGTGVLGIFALKRGASFVTSIDIDEWAFSNCKENFRVNQCHPDSYEIIRGDRNSIPEKSYDIILANINRNILLEDINRYLLKLKINGMLIISGILKKDREVLISKAGSEGVSFMSELCENKWISLIFRK